MTLIGGNARVARNMNSGVFPTILHQVLRAGRAEVAGFDALSRVLVVAPRAVPYKITG